MTHRRIIGIDLSGPVIRAALLERRGEELHLLGTGEAAAGLSPAEAVRAACRAAGVRRGAAALALPRAETVVRSLRLPAADAARTAQMLQLEAVHHVPFPADQVAFGFLPLPAPPEVSDRPHLLLATGSRQLAGWQQAVTEAGCKPLWAAAPGPALAALVANSGQPVVVLHLAQTLGIDVWDGSLLLSRNATRPEPGEEHPTSLADHLAGEIERSLLSCPPLSQAPEVVLTGEGASAALAGELAARLGLVCRVWQSVDHAGVEWGQAKLGPAFALAVAVALQALTSPDSLSLRVHESATAAQGRSRALTVTLLAIPAAMLVIFLLLTTGSGGERDARAAALRTQVARLERQAIALRGTEQALSARLARRMAIEPVRVLAERAPSGVWFTSLAWGTGGDGSARGRALDTQAVAKLVSALSDSQAFRDLKLAFVRQSKVGDTPVIEFGLTWEAEAQP